MKTFVIDSLNCVHSYASSKAARQCRDGTRFATEKDFASALSNLPMLRLVAIWNQLPGAKPARKFTNRDTAVRRIWAAIQDLAPEARTKADLVIGMINRPSGATLKEIMAATGWQAHSVRGFLSAQPKKLGFRVESFKRDGERVYRIR
jgi:hypothetical protein